MSLDRANLFLKIKNGKAFDLNEFNEGLYDDSVLIAFLENGNEILHLIPKGVVTEEIFEIAVEEDKCGRIMRHINPEDTLNYAKLAMSAISLDAKNVRYLSPSVIDTEFFFKALSYNSKTLSEFFVHHPELMDLIDSEILDDKIFKHCFSAEIISVCMKICTGEIVSERFSDDFIKLHLARVPGVASPVFRSDKRFLISDVIRNGQWPDNIDKPLDINDCFKKIFRATSSVFSIWYKGYILAQPLEEVIKNVKTESRIELIETLYSREELIPHMRNNHRALGRWLERDIGL